MVKKCPGIINDKTTHEIKHIANFVRMFLMKRIKYVLDIYYLLLYIQ